MRREIWQNREGIFASFGMLCQQNEKFERIDHDRKAHCLMVKNIIEKYNILILTDSRLKDNNYFPLTYIYSIRGGGLEEVRKLGLEILATESYHLVIVLAGINDLTTLNKASWIVSPVYDDLWYTVDSKTDMFVCGISLTSGQLFNELFPDCTRDGQPRGDSGGCVVAVRHPLWAAGIP